LIDSAIMYLTDIFAATRAESILKAFYQRWRATSDYVIKKTIAVFDRMLLYPMNHLKRFKRTL